MKRPVIIVIAAIVLVAVVGLLYFVNRPTFISGDPWDYNLSKDDLSGDWVITNTSIETPYDIARDSNSDSHGLISAHSIQFNNQLAIDVFEITSQVLLYDSVESASAALVSESSNDEWEKLTASRSVGEETVVWHLKPIEEAPQQAAYRVDFRFLNGVASVGVTGTVEGLPDDSAALSYAGQVLSNMQNGARPESLSTLGNRPDLRILLLTQNDLARIDSEHGDQWIYNSLLLPGWTPNSAFDNPEGMNKLGRLTGYQTWLIKPLNAADLRPEATVQFFQQVTAFQSPESAQATLEKMVGLNSGAWRVTPDVGEAAKGWTEVYQADATSANPGAVSATEISFRVGAYTGSIRVQTSPVTETEIPLARAANELLANQFALALASKLENAGK